MNQLPTYRDSINGFVPPPSYQDVIVSSPSNQGLIPNEYSSIDYYISKDLQFVEVSEDEYEDDEINDEDVLRFVEAMDLKDDDRSQVVLRSEDEIADLMVSLQLLLHDKLTQISRNASFIEKRIITKSNNYYINNLRIQTFQDFMRIRDRIIHELENLQQDIYYPIRHFNSLYQSTLIRIKSLEIELSNSFKSSNKSQSITITRKLYQQHFKLSQIKFNLQQIDSKIQKLNKDDDVSYVLKERARVYNDAKQIILNQLQTVIAINNSIRDQ